MMTDIQFIDYLIELGGTAMQPSNEDEASYRYLPLSWNTLTDDKLILLFKGLVIYEEFLISIGQKIGSATQTKFVYNEIRKRRLDDDYSLGNWAFVSSSNPYVPLDSGNRHGATTIFEYIGWQREVADRTYQEQVDAIKRKEEKKRLKAEAHAERLKKKEERDKLLGYKK